jgi:membrane protein
VEFGEGVCVAWVDDFAPSMGAAIAYYGFSIAPLLVIILAIAGHLRQGSG